MKFSFKSRIYKVGINPCVKVPAHITEKMNPVKGYIPVKGIMHGYAFSQTLCPVKNDLYRLYVNGYMLKGSDKKSGIRPRSKLSRIQNQERTSKCGVS